MLMHRASVVLLLLAAPALAACGDSPAARSAPDPFQGRFTATFRGSPVGLTLAREGNRLSLVFEAGGQRQEMQAIVDGDVATGSFTDPKVAGEGRATLASRDADHLRLTLVARNAFGGENSVPFDFVRETARPASSASAPTGPAADPAARDPALVGVWRKSSSYTSGPSFSMVSETYLTLRADGSFRYGDTKLAGGTAGVSVSSEGGGATVGQWKTADRHFFTRERADEAWEQIARYYVEGDDMLATRPGGKKELWKRIR